MGKAWRRGNLVLRVRKVKYNVMDEPMRTAWQSFLENGSVDALAVLLEEHPEVTQLCRRSYPYLHRIGDVIIGKQVYRCCRCVECGERVFLFPIEQGYEAEAGVPLWLAGDRLRSWVVSEVANPTKGEVDWNRFRESRPPLG